MTPVNTDPDSSRSKISNICSQIQKERLKIGSFKIQVKSRIKKNVQTILNKLKHKADVMMFTPTPLEKQSMGYY